MQIGAGGVNVSVLIVTVLIGLPTRFVFGANDKEKRAAAENYADLLRNLNEAAKQEALKKEEARTLKKRLGTDKSRLMIYTRILSNLEDLAKKIIPSDSNQKSIKSKFDIVFSNDRGSIQRYEDLILRIRQRITSVQGSIVRANSRLDELGESKKGAAVNVDFPRETLNAEFGRLEGAITSSENEGSGLAGQDRVDHSFDVLVEGANAIALRTLGQSLNDNGPTAPSNLLDARNPNFGYVGVLGIPEMNMQSGPGANGARVETISIPLPAITGAADRHIALIYSYENAKMEHKQAEKSKDIKTKFASLTAELGRLQILEKLKTLRANEVDQIVDLERLIQTLRVDQANKSVILQAGISESGTEAVDAIIANLQDLLQEMKGAHSEAAEALVREKVAVQIADAKADFESSLTSLLDFGKKNGLRMQLVGGLSANVAKQLRNAPQADLAQRKAAETAAFMEVLSQNRVSFDIRFGWMHEAQDSPLSHGREYLALGANVQLLSTNFNAIQTHFKAMHEILSVEKTQTEKMKYERDLYLLENDVAKLISEVQQRISIVQKQQKLADLVKLRSGKQGYADAAIDVAGGDLIKAYSELWGAFGLLMQKNQELQGRLEIISGSKGTFKPEKAAGTDVRTLSEQIISAYLRTSPSDEGVKLEEVPTPSLDIHTIPTDSFLIDNEETGNEAFRQAARTIVEASGKSEDAEAAANITSSILFKRANVVGHQSDSEVWAGKLAAKYAELKKPGANGQSLLSEIEFDKGDFYRQMWSILLRSGFVMTARAEDLMRDSKIDLNHIAFAEFLVTLEDVMSSRLGEPVHINLNDIAEARKALMKKYPNRPEYSMRSPVEGAEILTLVLYRQFGGKELLGRSFDDILNSPQDQKLIELISPELNLNNLFVRILGYKLNQNRYMETREDAVEILSDMKGRYDKKTGKYMRALIDQSDPHVEAEIMSVLSMMNFSGLPKEVFQQHYGKLIARFSGLISSSDFYRVTEEKLLKFWKPTIAVRLKAYLDEMDQNHTDSITVEVSKGKKVTFTRAEILKRYHGEIDPILEGLVRGDASSIVQNIFFGNGIEEAADRAAWQALTLEQRVEIMEKRLSVVEKLSATAGQMLGLGTKSVEENSTLRAQIQGILWGIAPDVIAGDGAWAPFFKADGSPENPDLVRVLFEYVLDAKNKQQILDYIKTTDPVRYEAMTPRQRQGLIMVLARDIVLDMWKAKEEQRAKEEKGKAQPKKPGAFLDLEKIFKSPKFLMAAVGDSVPSPARVLSAEDKLREEQKVSVSRVISETLGRRAIIQKMAQPYFQLSSAQLANIDDELQRYRAGNPKYENIQDINDYLKLVEQDTAQYFKWVHEVTAVKSEVGDELAGEIDTLAKGKLGYWINPAEKQEMIKLINGADGNPGLKGISISEEEARAWIGEMLLQGEISLDNPEGVMDMIHRKIKVEMFLQATHMLYHKTADGKSVLLDKGKMSSKSRLVLARPDAWQDAMMQYAHEIKLEGLVDLSLNGFEYAGPYQDLFLNFPQEFAKNLNLVAHELNLPKQDYNAEDVMVLLTADKRTGLAAQIVKLASFGHQHLTEQDSKATVAMAFNYIRDFSLIEAINYLAHDGHFAFEAIDGEIRDARRGSRYIVDPQYTIKKHLAEHLNADYRSLAEVSMSWGDQTENVDLNLYRFLRKAFPTTFEDVLPIRDDSKLTTPGFVLHDPLWWMKEFKAIDDAIGGDKASINDRIAARYSLLDFMKRSYTSMRTVTFPQELSAKADSAAYKAHIEKLRMDSATTLQKLVDSFISTYLERNKRLERTSDPAVVEQSLIVRANVDHFKEDRLARRNVYQQRLKEMGYSKFTLATADEFKASSEDVKALIEALSSWDGWNHATPEEKELREKISKLSRRELEVFANDILSQGTHPQDLLIIRHLLAPMIRIAYREVHGESLPFGNRDVQADIDGWAQELIQVLKPNETGLRYSAESLTEAINRFKQKQQIVVELGKGVDTLGLSWDTAKRKQSELLRIASDAVNQNLTPEDVVRWFERAKEYLDLRKALNPAYAATNQDKLQALFYADMVMELGIATSIRQKESNPAAIVNLWDSLFGWIKNPEAPNSAYMIKPQNLGAADKARDDYNYNYFVKTWSRNLSNTLRDFIAQGKVPKVNFETLLLEKAKQNNRVMDEIFDEVKAEIAALAKVDGGISADSLYDLDLKFRTFYQNHLNEHAMSNDQPLTDRSPRIARLSPLHVLIMVDQSTSDPAKRIGILNIVGRKLGFEPKDYQVMEEYYSSVMEGVNYRQNLRVIDTLAPVDESQRTIFSKLFNPEKYGAFNFVGLGVLAGVLSIVINWLYNKIKRKEGVTGYTAETLAKNKTALLKSYLKDATLKSLTYVALFGLLAALTPWAIAHAAVIPFISLPLLAFVHYIIFMRPLIDQLSYLAISMPRGNYKQLFQVKFWSVAAIGFFAPAVLMSVAGTLMTLWPLLVIPAMILVQASIRFFSNKKNAGFIVSPSMDPGSDRLKDDSLKHQNITDIFSQSLEDIAPKKTTVNLSAEERSKLAQPPLINQEDPRRSIRDEVGGWIAESRTDGKLTADDQRRIAQVLGDETFDRFMVDMTAAFFNGGSFEDERRIIGQALKSLMLNNYEGALSLPFLNGMNNAGALHKGQAVAIDIINQYFAQLQARGISTEILDSMAERFISFMTPGSRKPSHSLMLGLTMAFGEDGRTVPWGSRSYNGKAVQVNFTPENMVLLRHLLGENDEAVIAEILKNVEVYVGPAALEQRTTAEAAARGKQVVYIDPNMQMNRDGFYHGVVRVVKQADGQYKAEYQDWIQARQEAETNDSHPLNKILPAELTRTPAGQFLKADGTAISAALADRVLTVTGVDGVERHFLPHVSVVKTLDGNNIGSKDSILHFARAHVENDKVGSIQGLLSYEAETPSDFHRSGDFAHKSLGNVGIDDSQNNDHQRQFGKYSETIEKLIQDAMATEDLPLGGYFTRLNILTPNLFEHVGNHFKKAIVRAKLEVIITQNNPDLVARLGLDADTIRILQLELSEPQAKREMWNRVLGLKSVQVALIGLSDADQLAINTDVLARFTHMRQADWNTWRDSFNTSDFWRYFNGEDELKSNNNAELDALFHWVGEHWTDIQDLYDPVTGLFNATEANIEILRSRTASAPVNWEAFAFLSSNIWKAQYKRHHAIVQQLATDPRLDKNPVLWMEQRSALLVREDGTALMIDDRDQVDDYGTKTSKGFKWKWNDILTEMLREYGKSFARQKPQRDFNDKPKDSLLSNSKWWATLVIGAMLAVMPGWGGVAFVGLAMMFTGIIMAVVTMTSLYGIFSYYLSKIHFKLRYFVPNLFDSKNKVLLYASYILSFPIAMVVALVPTLTLGILTWSAEKYISSNIYLPRAFDLGDFWNTMHDGLVVAPGPLLYREGLIKSLWHDAFHPIMLLVKVITGFYPKWVWYKITTGFKVTMKRGIVQGLKQGVNANPGQDLFFPGFFVPPMFPPAPVNTEDLPMKAAMTNNRSTTFLMSVIIFAGLAVKIMLAASVTPAIAYLSVTAVVLGVFALVMRARYMWLNKDGKKSAYDTAKLPIVFNINSNTLKLKDVSTTLNFWQFVLAGLNGWGRNTVAAQLLAETLRENNMDPTNMTADEKLLNQWAIRQALDKAAISQMTPFVQGSIWMIGMLLASVYLIPVVFVVMQPAWYVLFVSLASAFIGSPTTTYENSLARKSPGQGSRKLILKGAIGIGIFLFLTFHPLGVHWLALALQSFSDGSMLVQATTVGFGDTSYGLAMGLPGAPAIFLLINFWLLTGQITIAVMGLMVWFWRNAVVSNVLKSKMRNAILNANSIDALKKRVSIVKKKHGVVPHYRITEVEKWLGDSKLIPPSFQNDSKVKDKLQQLATGVVAPAATRFSFGKFIRNSAIFVSTSAVVAAVISYFAGRGQWLADKWAAIIGYFQTSAPVEKAASLTAEETETSTSFLHHASEFVAHHWQQGLAAVVLAISVGILIRLGIKAYSNRQAAAPVILDDRDLRLTGKSYQGAIDAARMNGVLLAIFGVVSAVATIYFVIAGTAVFTMGAFALDGIVVLVYGIRMYLNAEASVEKRFREIERTESELAHQLDSTAADHFIERLGSLRGEIDSALSDINNNLDALEQALSAYAGFINGFNPVVYNQATSARMAEAIRVNAAFIESAEAQLAEKKAALAPASDERKVWDLGESETNLTAADLETLADRFISSGLLGGDEARLRSKLSEIISALESVAQAVIAQNGETHVRNQYQETVRHMVEGYVDGAIEAIKAEQNFYIASDDVMKALEEAVKLSNAEDGNRKVFGSYVKEAIQGFLKPKDPQIFEPQKAEPGVDSLPSHAEQDLKPVLGADADAARGLRINGTSGANYEIVGVNGAELMATLRERTFWPQLVTQHVLNSAEQETIQDGFKYSWARQANGDIWVYKAAVLTAGKFGVETRIFDVVARSESRNGARSETRLAPEVVAMNVEVAKATTAEVKATLVAAINTKAEEQARLAAAAGSTNEMKINALLPDITRGQEARDFVAASINEVLAGLDVEADASVKGIVVINAVNFKTPASLQAAVDENLRSGNQVIVATGGASRAVALTASQKLTIVRGTVDEVISLNKWTTEQLQGAVQVKHLAQVGAEHRALIRTIAEKTAERLVFVTDEKVDGVKAEIDANSLLESIATEIKTAVATAVSA